MVDMKRYIVGATMALVAGCATTPATSVHTAVQEQPLVKDDRAAVQEARAHTLHVLRKLQHSQQKHHVRHTHTKQWVRRSGDPTPQQLARLRWCESGRDGTWKVNSSSNARGLYQFLIGTWYGVGGHGDPAAASQSEQTYRAILLYRKEGWRPWLASSSCSGLY